LIESKGGQAIGSKLDVTSSEDWSAMMSSVGDVNGLAAVAGIAPTGDTVEAQTEEGWQRLIDIDLKGVWLGMRAVIPGMKRLGGGSIVNVASMSAVKGRKHLMAYSAAKGGVVAMTRQAAVEYLDSSIRINSVLPGAVRTPALQAREQARSAGTSLTVGTPEQLADVIAFVLSDGAGFMTGQEVRVDGGESAR
jgi:NAD(P)-dependent dehydrogenase (short-subunit alcohol dehydrogenase family)